MIEVKTADLIGPALDWAVAKAEGWDFSKEFYRIMVQGYCPSTDWSQGGPLIDRHRISVIFHDDDSRPCAWTDETAAWPGADALICLCRAIVAAKLGNTVQVPAELVTP